MHPLNDALTEPYLPVLVTRGALVAHRYTYDSASLQNLAVPQNFCAPTMLIWNDLGDPVLDGVELTGFKSRANAFFIGLSCSISTIVFYYFFLSRISVYRLLLTGWGLWTDSLHITLSQPCAANLF